MKKLAPVLALVALLGLAIPTFASDKTAICHVPPGNEGDPQTLELPDAALQAHLGDNEDGLHGGDYRGECEGPISTPTPTPTPTPTATPTPTETPDGPREVDFDVVPLCEYGGEFAWSISLTVPAGQPRDFTVRGEQGDETFLQVMLAGTQNIVVFGSASGGDVTWSLDDDDLDEAVWIVAGDTEPCVPERVDEPQATLPPTDTAQQTAADQALASTWMLAVVVLGLISGAIGAFLFCKR